MQNTFDTPDPAVLFVEIGSGSVRILATDVEQTTVDVSGPGADDVVVEQRGHQIVVIQPKRVNFMSFDRSVNVDVVLPTHSEVTTRLGSADLVIDGTIGWAKLNSGSGDVTVEHVSAEARIKAGSGDIAVRTLAGSSHITSGSGQIQVDRIEGVTTLGSGSGDILVGHVTQPISAKSGSGDVVIREALDDADLATASGDVQVDRFPAGKLSAKNASGDIRVGIPAGVPVWTDVTSITGRVASTLQGAGQPAEGQPYVELRARTVSGDVVLEQI